MRVYRSVKKENKLQIPQEVSRCLISLAFADELENVREQVTNHADRIGIIETRYESATKQLQALPEPKVKVEKKTDRAMLNERVRAYAEATAIPHEKVWGRLYRELYYRRSFNAKERAKRQGITKLDAVERAELMPDLYAIACEVLQIPAKDESLL